jgi:hypothetical protein
MQRIAMVGISLAVLSAPAFAQHHSGSSAFLGGALGAGLGTVLGNAVSQPAPPPAAVYVAPAPVYVTPRPVYVAPVPVQPAYTLEAQMKLHDLGLLYGPVDGVFGWNTKRAIQAWQTQHGMVPTGYLAPDQLPILLASVPTIPPAAQAAPVPVAVPPPAAVIATPVVQAAAVAAPPATQLAAPVLPAAVTTQQPVQPATDDPLGGIKDGMAYGQARQKLLSVGWQTGYFTPTTISDSDRDNRAYFVDHHINEVEDCSASGCAMQFHNNDGRLLYVFTEAGARNSDAYHGAGPAVIGFCLDHKDLACAPAPQTQAAAR